MRADWLEHAAEPHVFGGKAAALATAVRAGLPVPRGFAVSVELVDAVARGERAACDRLDALHAELDCGAVAVRSSAVGEDGASTSFAGQHATKLNVTGGLADAVRAVWHSGRSDSARAYRARLGVAGEPRVAVIVQCLVRAEVAGVLFTRDPITGNDERVIEATWGLGEAVVAGLIAPDRYRLARDGRVVERVAGMKDVMIAPRAGGGVEEVAIDPARARAHALPDSVLAGLHALACRCEQVWAGEGHDIEWALADGKLHLLQRRPITRSR